MAKFTAHIPTVQYGFVEIEAEDARELVAALEETATIGVLGRLLSGFQPLDEAKAQEAILEAPEPSQSPETAPAGPVFRKVGQ